MSTKKAYVIGTHVRKSLSPLIFNYWFHKYGLDAKYTYKEITEKNLNREVGEIFKEKNLCGINVTIPFKEKIIKKLHRIDKSSKLIGAVNCVTIKNQQLLGFNTDWIGYKNAYLIKNKNTKTNKPAIIIGFGGAAKAILYSLKNLGYQKVYIFNRTLNDVPKKYKSAAKILPLTDLEKHLEEASHIVNTIPKNILYDLGIKKITKKTSVADIVYTPMETKFLKSFVNSPHKVYGISMLIYQAVPCFEKWFGFKPVVDKKLLSITNKILKK